ncbi:helix-turn-helix domain-containing protein [Streptosporangium sp. KLBMP 9127]|nr:helix-turn-helix domain-containing protein [Streptosporangium sp. KLBMP 9127]
MNEPAQHGPGRLALIRARKRQGLTQEAAAEQIGVSATTWARWERGKQGVRPVYRARIAQTWQVDAAEVERWLDTTPDVDAPHREDSPPWEDEDASGSAASSVEAAGRLWRWEMDASRRHLLTGLPFVPAMLGEWLLSWRYDSAASPALSSGSGPAVGLADVQRVLDARVAFSRMDHHFGAGLVRPAVTDFMHYTLAPLLRGSYTDRVGAELLTAAATMTQLAGWMAFDLGHHGQAQHHYGQALKLAKAAHSPLVAASVLATLAHQARDLNQPRWAVRLSQAAVDAGHEAKAPPRVMAMLLLRQAHTLAAQAAGAESADPHTKRRVTTLLAEADVLFATGPSDGNPAWITDFSQAELAGEGSLCWHAIGDHRRSAAAAQQALDGFGADHTRSVQLTHISAAKSQLAMGELEQALDSARAAARGAKELTSTRAITFVRDFHIQLQPHRANRLVKEFDTYLETELAG